MNQTKAPSPPACGLNFLEALVGMLAFNLMTRTSRTPFAVGAKVMVGLWSASDQVRRIGD